ncbi:putative copper homeostasis (lipo)protein LpqS [Mycobacterium avium]
MGLMGPQSPPGLDAAIGNVFAASPVSADVDTDCCSGTAHDFAVVMPPRWTSSSVAGAVVAALVALVGWLVVPVLAATRGPPCPARAVIPPTGRTILTQICIARR